MIKRDSADYRAYQDYLKSPEWREIRKIVLDRAQYTCERCGKASLNLQVHHVHYDTLFDEDPETDLEALCTSCHEMADRDRAFDAGLATYARRKYGMRVAWWDVDRVPDHIVLEFSDWLDGESSAPGVYF